MKIGIVVGRFQSHKLTNGHKELIEGVMLQNDKVLIFIGVYPLKPNLKNSLSFEMRKQMILEFIKSNPFPEVENVEVIILPIADVFDIPLWSKNLDKSIRDNMDEYDWVTLYGSRDSFIFNYKGIFKTKEIEALTNISATELRNKIVTQTDESDVTEEFRKGVIWAMSRLEV